MALIPHTNLGPPVTCTMVGEVDVHVLIVHIYTAALTVLLFTRGICVHRLPPTVDSLQLGVIIMVHLPLSTYPTCTRRVPNQSTK